jgi:hypothetical protein
MGLKSWPQWLAALVLSIAASAALGREDLDGAFVILSQGGEILVPERAQDQPVPALSRLVPGTRLRLADGGRLQLLYLPDGRLETWQGRAVVTVGVAETQGLAVRSEPQVRRLPAPVAEALALSALTLADWQPGRAPNRGDKPGRSKDPALRLKPVQDQYAALREQAGEESLLPELYLIAALENVQAYPALREAFDELLRKQPENPAVQALRLRYEKLLAEPIQPGPRPGRR